MKNKSAHWGNSGSGSDRPLVESVATAPGAAQMRLPVEPGSI